MWLLETNPTLSRGFPLKLRYFDTKKLASTPYAILSHTWSKQAEDEVIFADVVAQKPSALHKKGYDKVRNTLEQAWKDKYEYVWVDNCCIDKSSSAELSEAINSMFSWYKAANKCYAYLADVSSEDNVYSADSEFRASNWFKRGWTLQELLAPEDVVFFSKDWKPIGDKTQLEGPVSEVTGIDTDILAGIRPIESASIAKRMSWAAKRETTRLEDSAYSLIGIFDINMPMLYGEGPKAFLRLQEEIMKQSDDHSIFAWANRSLNPSLRHGLLADSPADFDFPEARQIVPYSSWERESAYGMTNRGLDIELHMWAQAGDSDRFMAALHCTSSSSQGHFLAVTLQRLALGDGNDKFARVECHKLQQVSERGNTMSIFIPQTIPQHQADGVFPLHLFQLRDLPNGFNITVEAQTTSFDASDRRLMPNLDLNRTFKIVKEARKVAVVLRLADSQTDSHVLIRLGTTHPFKVGFDIAKDPGADFEPLERGRTAMIPTHHVRVDMPERVVGGAKIYQVRLTIHRVQVDGPVTQVVKAAGQVVEPHLERLRLERPKQLPVEPTGTSSDRKSFRRALGIRR